MIQFHNKLLKNLHKGKERIKDVLHTTPQYNRQKQYNPETVAILIKFTTERYKIGQRVTLNNNVTGTIISCDIHSVDTDDNNIKNLYINVIVEFDDGVEKKFHSLRELCQLQKPLISEKPNPSSNQTTKTINNLIKFATERYGVDKQITLNNKLGTIIHCEANDVGTSDGTVRKFDFHAIVRFTDNTEQEFYSLGEICKAQIVV